MTPGAAFLAGAVAGGAVGGLAAREAYRRKAALFGRLFSFAMHELNTPITAVNMTVLNLLSEVFGQLPPPLKPWIEMTREQVGRLNGLVGEVRDFVHMELHEDLRVSRVELTVAEILDEALVSIRRGMEQAGVDFTVVTAPDLPGVLTDPDRAARCLSSILFHARKFRTGGPITLKVFRAPGGAGAVAFAVSYQGARLRPEEIEASLDLYYPARMRKDQVLGATGLGLGLIRRVARLIGGDLDFIAEEDGRAAVTLRCASAGGKS
ncbi:MAG: HAMP domain-containing sensor histidine kinase [Elusimicrobia bacterium]|nr:HAMP domain-containing sensor histidine kinase [Elusimicrobiota bacterium]